MTPIRKYKTGMHVLLDPFFKEKGFLYGCDFAIGMRGIVRMAMGGDHSISYEVTIIDPFTGKDLRSYVFAEIDLQPLTLYSNKDAVSFLRK